MFMRHAATYIPPALETRPNVRRSKPSLTAENFTITLTTEQLCASTEGGVLCLLVSVYGFRHPAEKAVDAVASLVKLNRATIQKAMNDDSHIGDLAWIVLQKEGVDEGLHDRWVAAHKEAQP